MHVLVTWGSKMGGTEGIARMIADDLRQRGVEVTDMPTREVAALGAINADAVVIGGALYANRWHKDARRFVTRNVAELRRVPVWLFSSGPLDDSAQERDIPPTKQLAVLMERVGALGHATFGGRLAADAKGFPASAMAKEHSGDWRNREQIRRWADALAAQLPEATPGVAVDHAGGAPQRLVVYGAFGWAVCALLLFGLSHTVGTRTAVALYAVMAPLVFVAVSLRYFRIRGAREPLPTALGFAAVVLALDALLTAGTSLAGFWATWLPLVLIVAATWTTGTLATMMPMPTGPSRHAHRTHEAA